MAFKINWNILFRKKVYTIQNVTNTHLLRVLGLLDICAIGLYSKKIHLFFPFVFHLFNIGISSTLCGIYILSN
jgi:hypothetical protein